MPDDFIPGATPSADLAAESGLTDATTSESPPAPASWDTPDNPYFSETTTLKQQQTELQQRLDALQTQYQQVLTPYQQMERQREQAVLTQAYQRLTSFGIPADEAQTLMGWVQQGQTFMAQQGRLNDMAKEHMAFQEATRLLGDNATVGDVKRFMERLITYNDPGLLRDAAKLLAEYRQTGRRQEQANNGSGRMESAPRAAVGTLDFDGIEAKMSGQGVNSLTASEKKRYNEGRRAQGLPGGFRGF